MSDEVSQKADRYTPLRNTVISKQLHYALQFQAMQ